MRTLNEKYVSSESFAYNKLLKLENTKVIKPKLAYTSSANNNKRSSLEKYGECSTLSIKSSSVENETESTMCNVVQSNDEKQPDLIQSAAVNITQSSVSTENPLDRKLNEDKNSIESSLRLIV